MQFCAKIEIIDGFLITTITILVNFETPKFKLQ
ncbi:hypothetical protein FBBAL38_00200 [Flavobacteria bacterium BAL38]|nr:hypothetical protein FBBAL38_00200 [Flavobacteria bacterium BAL38]